MKVGEKVRLQAVGLISRRLTFRRVDGYSRPIERLFVVPVVVPNESSHRVHEHQHQSSTNNHSPLIRSLVNEIAPETDEEAVADARDVENSLGDHESNVEEQVCCGYERNYQEREGEQHHVSVGLCGRGRTAQQLPVNVGRGTIIHHPSLVLVLQGFHSDAPSAVALVPALGIHVLIDEQGLLVVILEIVIVVVIVIVDLTMLRQRRLADLTPWRIIASPRRLRRRQPPNVETHDFINGVVEEERREVPQVEDGRDAGDRVHRPVEAEPLGKDEK